MYEMMRKVEKMSGRPIEMTTRDVAGNPQQQKCRNNSLFYFGLDSLSSVEEFVGHQHEFHVVISLRVGVLLRLDEGLDVDRQLHFEGNVRTEQHGYRSLTGADTRGVFRLLFVVLGSEL